MKKRGKRNSARTFGAFIAAFSCAGALVQACGLDDSVVIENGGSTNQDATFAGDSASSGDSAIAIDSGAVVDAGPDVIHEPPDSADPDDADLSDAAIADGGCDSGTFECVTGTGTFCLNSCVVCPSNHAACAGTNMCGASCGACSGTVECYRSNFGFQSESCVASPSVCSTVGGGRVFCGPAFGFFIDCPGTDQVCEGNACYTCGEIGTSGQGCSPSANGTCSGVNPTCH